MHLATLFGLVGLQPHFLFSFEAYAPTIVSLLDLATNTGFNRPSLIIALTLY
jgi:hypothetical protein